MNHPAPSFIEKESSADITFRPIRYEDNEQAARLIRTVMTEFGCVGEGYSINDPEIDDMFGVYKQAKAKFFVVTRKVEDTKILGCGGIGPLPGSNDDTCELKKMYFYDELRGHGFGRKMVELCLETARQLGYRRCYLETVNRMEAANVLYKKLGFKKLDSPMGATGHCSCEGWYVKEL